MAGTTFAFTEEQKTDIYVKIAQYWFEADDELNAEKYINKATNTIDLVNHDKDLVTRYKFCKAKVLDSKRQFILASVSYYDLSHSTQLAEEGMMEVL